LLYHSLLFLSYFSTYIKPTNKQTDVGGISKLGSTAIEPP